MEQSSEIYESDLHHHRDTVSFYAHAAAPVSNVMPSKNQLNILRIELIEESNQHIYIS